MTTATTQEAIRYEKDAAGVVTLTIDMPGQSANTMNTVFRDAYRAAVDRIAEELDRVSGVIITSAKKTFFAGGDLNACWPSAGREGGVRSTRSSR